MRIDVQNAILKVVSYFHFFRYPVTKQEIWQFASVHCSEIEFESSLSDLLRKTALFKISDFYSLENDLQLAERRKQGNFYAQKQLKKAYRIARFLGNFPFVEAICISGSLSKDCSAPGGDLDFFIITAPNRLWIARTIMHFFKKFTFLVNAQHSFCMNYYIDMQNLDVNPKNLFTAIEIATLKPAFAQRGAEEFFASNAPWTDMFLPNNDYLAKHRNHTHKKNALTRFFENIINRSNGDRWNAALYNFTRRQWINKWNRKHYDVAKCLQCMDLHVNTPVNHPKDLMDVILRGHEEIYSSVAQETGIFEMSADALYVKKIS